MQSPLNISLSPLLSEWVEAQATRRGFAAPAEFVSDLVRREHEKDLSLQLDQRVSGAMRTLVSEMTESQWNDVRRAGHLRHHTHHSRD